MKPLTIGLAIFLIALILIDPFSRVEKFHNIPSSLIDPRDPYFEYDLYRLNKRCKK